MREITDEEITQHVVKATFGVGDDKLQVIQDWMNYKGFSSFPEIVLESLHVPGKIQNHTSYKNSGATHDIHQDTYHVGQGLDSNPHQCDLPLSWISQHNQGGIGFMGS